MECFIIKDGIEKKAELEDILPLMGDREIQSILRDDSISYFSLPRILAQTSSEIKDLIYRNMSLRISGTLEKEIIKEETDYQKDDIDLKWEKRRFISHIGEYGKEILCDWPEYIVWRELKIERKVTVEEPPNPVNELIKIIEAACNSGHLKIRIRSNFSEEDMQNAFTAFENRLDELQRIRTLEILVEYLPGAAYIFEVGSIKDLILDGDPTDSWPSFLDKNLTLDSIQLDMWQLTELPLWIRNVGSLKRLSIVSINLTIIPDWIGELQSLSYLSLHYNGHLKTLPDSIGNLKNLTHLNISCHSIEKMPDSISKLKELIILELSWLPIEKIPDWIGDLKMLKELHLKSIKKIKGLPDSIGKLNKLVKLVLNDLYIEKLPFTILNCTSLEYIDIRRTNIDIELHNIPSLKTILRSIELIPNGKPISYNSFCNSYYRLAETMIRFHDIAKKEGILELENEIENLSNGFFRKSMEFVVDGTDTDILRYIMTLRIEREHDYYRKKLMEIAMEGILCIQNGEAKVHLISKLVALVDIGNNPLDTAYMNYISGDREALDHIDFTAAIQPEKEREEIRFIRRAIFLSKISREKGILALDKYLDHEGIAAKDVFEYGLPLVIDYLEYERIDNTLNKLISHETNPVRKNLALAKKEAIRLIYECWHPSITKASLLAYFDDSIERELTDELD